MLNEFSGQCHLNAVNKGFYEKVENIINKLENNQDKEVLENLFKCQQLLLIITELTEATEELRCNNINKFNVEIADTFLRLFDLVGYLNIDIEKEIKEKILINKKRPKLHNKEF